MYGRCAVTESWFIVYSTAPHSIQEKEWGALGEGKIDQLKPQTTNTVVIQSSRGYHCLTDVLDRQIDR